LGFSENKPLFERRPPSPGPARPTNVRPGDGRKRGADGGGHGAHRRRGRRLLAVHRGGIPRGTGGLVKTETAVGRACFLASIPERAGARSAAA
jgi:hypothetical protein